eukprot:8824982-Pyramimonas_sp.AAC.3
MERLLVVPIHGVERPALRVEELLGVGLGDAVDGPEIAEILALVHAAIHPVVGELVQPPAALRLENHLAAQRLGVIVRPPVHGRCNSCRCRNDSSIAGIASLAPIGCPIQSATRRSTAQRTSLSGCTCCRTPGTAC